MLTFAAIIFASKALTPDVDKKFLASINTFRRIPPQEANALKSLRLAIVPAQQGDTVASLTQRMAIADRGLDVFLLINGWWELHRLGFYTKAPNIGGPGSGVGPVGAPGLGWVCRRPMSGTAAVPMPWAAAPPAPPAHRPHDRTP